MIRIEQATTEHIAQMADLLAVLFSEEVEFRPDREKQIRALRMIVSAPERGNIFVATEEDEVVGMTSLLFTISTAQGAPACWLEDMVIRPEHRGKGIGTKLLSPRRGLRQVERLHPHHALDRPHERQVDPLLRAARLPALRDGAHADAPGVRRCNEIS